MRKIIESVPFSSIMYYPKLFTDYIERFDSVAEFYLGNPADGRAWTAQFHRCAERKYLRQNVVQILLRQNPEYSGLKRAVAQNIYKLENPRSVAVVTGQQAGLFGGPLYTIYKALTAVRYAEYIEEHFEIPAVPIFWLEVDDHDFDEVRRVTLMVPGGEIKTVTYTDGRETEPIPIKDRIIAETIRSFLEEIIWSFSTAEMGSNVLAKITSIYTPGRSFPDAFIEFFRTFFPRVPIVFFNPGDSKIKQLAQPFFQRAIQEHTAIHNAIKVQSDALQRKSYELQVPLHTGDYHLFHCINGRRIRLNEQMVFSGQSHKENEKQRITQFLERSITGISPDVLLRPVLQDYVLPTAVYVGGPSEIAYCAQLKRVYAMFDVPMPLIVPRWSGTIIEKKSLRFLKNLRIEPGRLLQEKPDVILNLMVEQSSNERFSPQFQKTYLQLKDRLDEIRKIGASLDGTLIGMIDNSEQKMKYQLDKIEGRFYTALQKANQVSAERACRTLKTVMPIGMLQERTFTVLNYLLRYGKMFSRFLTRTITIETNKHHIIEY